MTQPRCECCGNRLTRIRDERLVCLQATCPNPTRINLQAALELDEAA
jgi:hypothetical protein